MRNDRFLWAICVGLVLLLVILSIYHINSSYELRKEVAKLELIVLEQKHRLQTLKNTNEVLTEAFECQELRRQLGLIYGRR